MHTNIYWNKTNEVGSEFALHSTCLSEVARCYNTFAAHELVNSKCLFRETSAYRNSPITNDLTLEDRSDHKNLFVSRNKNIKFLGEF